MSTGTEKPSDPPADHAYARRVLVLFAHPAIQRSQANRRLLDAIQGMPGITFHDLYEEYPDLHINVGREQRLLLEHDIIVYQHPFYWYSSPAILKEWQDLVLEYGFAYGLGGDQLRGKQVLTAITTGGPTESYRPGGLNNWSVREFLRPFEQTVRLCHMEYLPPFVVQGTLARELTEGVKFCGRDYREVLEALRDDRVDWPRFRQMEFANQNFTWIRGRAHDGD
jgi:glutathione-regulated potassium-efflux system ancillary protein KefG